MVIGKFTIILLAENDTCMHACGLLLILMLHGMEHFI